MTRMMKLERHYRVVVEETNIKRHCVYVYAQDDEEAEEKALDLVKENPYSKDVSILGFNENTLEVIQLNVKTSQER